MDLRSLKACNQVRGLGRRARRNVMELLQLAADDILPLLVEDELDLISNSIAKSRWIPVFC
jgi:hypothetical protein